MTDKASWVPHESRSAWFVQDGDLLLLGERTVTGSGEEVLRYAAALYARRRSPLCGEYWLLVDEDEMSWTDGLSALPHGYGCYDAVEDLILIRDENPVTLAHEQGHRLAGMCEDCADIVGAAIHANQPTTVRCPAHTK